MARRPDELFDKIKIKKLCNDIQITDEQRNAAKEWLSLLENNKLESEQQSRSLFDHFILQKILGFTVYDFVPEKHDVDYTIFNRESGNSLCIEVKGTKKNLLGYQDVDKKDKKIREKETPVDQTWRYMGDGHDYGICTNYNDFILLTMSGRTNKVHKFNFLSIKDTKNHLNEDKLKEFIGIFSKQGIFVEGIVEKLTNESVIAEREFTNEFYKLFHETRLMLIKEFSSLQDVSKDEAIHWAQIYLNRLIFVFFVEDHNFIPDRLFAKRILSILKSPSISEHTKIISENINDLFKIMNSGSKIHGVNGFNGGLFEKEIPPKIFFNDIKDPEFFKNQRQNSKLSQKSLLVDIDINLSSQYADSLNPIIKNLLIMDSYDFTSDLNVNILGHIFEQSIADIEKIKEEGISRRKKDGVYYTPEYITDYICRNTIIPYLSNKGVTSVSELVEEYADNIKELETRIKNIKILDPACGSGAFLVKAVEILFEIDEKIQASKPQSAKAQRGLEEYSKVKEINLIVESNIFGVDINPESVEITKLSLFLKLAGPNSKLTYLSNNIKMGNSLINDKTVDEHAFCWRDEFPEILGSLIKDKGFDVVIGNPPYVRVQFLDHKIIDWLKQNKETAYKRVDISTLFFELAKKLLKHKGRLSFITSNQFLVAEYGRKTRGFLSKNFKILDIVDFGDLRIFEDALTYVSIFTFENNKPSNFRYLRVRNLEDAKNIDLKKAIVIDVSNLWEDSWTLGEKLDLQLLDKLKKHSTIESIGRTGYGLITGLDEVLLLDEDEIKNLKIEKETLLPVIVGTDPERYALIKPRIFAIYPYKLLNDETIIIEEEKFRNKYPNAYQYLFKNKTKLQERKDSRKTFKDRKDWYSLVRFSTLENFYSDKIITPGEVKEHKFTIDYSKSGFLAARIFCVIVNDKNFNLKYVLAMLNSRVIKFFLRNTTPLKQGGYYGYSSSYLDTVPIPLVDNDTQTKIVKKVDRIFELNKIKKEKKERFLNRIIQNFAINITKKIENFSTLEFRDFMKELSKQKKTLSLKEQDNWEDYFVENKKNLLQLDEEIKVIDNELDEAAYRIYHLTSKERKSIEEFLKNE